MISLSKIIEVIDWRVGCYFLGTKTLSLFVRELTYFSNDIVEYFFYANAVKIINEYFYILQYQTNESLLHESDLYIFLA